MARRGAGGPVALRPCACGAAVDLEAHLDGLGPEGLRADGLLFLACPGCGAGLELRLKGARVEVGYTYASGSAHFEVLRTLKVPGLTAQAAEPDDLEVGLGERRWRFGNRTPVQRRVALLPGAWAVGRRLADLDLGRWDLVLEVVERDGGLLAPEGGLVLQAGDFLHLRGLFRSIDRAWAALHAAPGLGPAR